MVVSIVMPTFRQKRRYLKKSIEAILKQTYKDIELIIVPVFYDEKTLNILEKFSDKRIKIVKSYYALITHQMNLGAYVSRGKYILPGIGSDDVYYKKSISALVSFAEKKKSILTYPNFDVGNANLGIKRTKKCPTFDVKLLQKGCYICDDSLVLRKEFMKYLPMKNSDGKSRIWNIWKKMASIDKNRSKIFHINYRTHIYRDHGKAVHRNGSQSNYSAVELQSPYLDCITSLKNRNIDNISKNHFCIFIQDISLFLDNFDKFKFKKNILLWNKKNIDNLKYIDTNLPVYHWCYEDDVYDILSAKNIKIIQKLGSFLFAKNDIQNDFSEDLIKESK